MNLVFGHFLGAVGVGGFLVLVCLGVVQVCLWATDTQCVCVALLTLHKRVDRTAIAVAVANCRPYRAVACPVGLSKGD